MGADFFGSGGIIILYAFFPTIVATAAVFALTIRLLKTQANYLPPLLLLTAAAALCAHKDQHTIKSPIMAMFPCLVLFIFFFAEVFTLALRLI